MAEDRFTSEESRKLAVLIARVWSDPQLATEYARNPHAVLSGAGINLGGRDVPQIPEKPAELASQPVVAMASGSSASSISCATCPCSGCTASCACCVSSAEELGSKMDMAMKLANDPEGRAAARAMMAKWDIKLGSR